MWLDKMERHFYGVQPGVIMEGETMENLLPGEVRLSIQEMAARSLVMAAEPQLDKESGQVIPGRTGKMINIDASMRKVMKAHENQRIEAEWIYIEPHYSVHDIQAVTEPLGSYGTWISGSYQRFTNISLAVAAINNTLVWPGGVFSFNDTVGPRTAERGYMPAPVILMGGSDIDYGGGVCQLASTLYNAVRQSGLKITERHQHSKPVPYIEAGQDATVDYGCLDLKFLNDSPGPIIIKAGISRGKVWVQILGRRES
ncbi:VanW family protein [Syntrophomonas palmitatica]|uniref:VanW family protein n=1 Tax=Syntrophomonas palmitatica TaxID=402877 RepID=UPI001FA76A3A|nr:VanW family protein [Syntrophomonas palmitatica]